MTINTTCFDPYWPSSGCTIHKN